MILEVIVAILWPVSVERKIVLEKLIWLLILGVNVNPKSISEWDDDG